MKCEINRYAYDFQQFRLVRSFADSIINRKITINEANEKQSNLLKNILEFNYKVILRWKANRKKKRYFWKVWELTVNAFKSRIFPLKTTQGKGFKISTPKQMLQRLSIALV